MLYLLFSLLIIFYVLRDLINGRRNRTQTNSDNNHVKEEKQDEISRRNSEAVKLDRLKLHLNNTIAGDALLSPVGQRKISRTKILNETQASGSRSRRTSTTNMVFVDATPFEESRTHPQDTEIIEIHEFPTPRESSVYAMNKKRRGRCVIFHHQEFNEGNGDYREGSQYDVEKIYKAFEKELRFEITVYENLKFFDLCETIKELSKEEDHSDADCICIFILSHGGFNGTIHARDVSYPFSVIWKPFLECKTLVGKPKLFFVQACRGRTTDQGNMGRHATDSTDAMYTIPTHADFLFGYSTVDDHYAFRDLKAGTWYIDSLCRVIRTHWREYDLTKMLTETSRTVALYYTSSSNNPALDKKKQIPTFTSTLTRQLYFTPKD